LCFAKKQQSLKPQNYLKMTEKSIENKNKTDFKNLIPEYSDDEILSILKKRKHYQKEAAELAIEEAIKRELIHSEQDLFSDSFKDKPLKSSIFPAISRDGNKEKIRKSIARGLILLGSVPTVWGILNISEGTIPEGILLVFLGASWIYASAKLMRSISLQMVNVLFIILFASALYNVKLFFEIKNPGAMDFVIPIVLTTLVAYGLLFLRKLND
jgi:hypothetical protein